MSDLKDFKKEEPPYEPRLQRFFNEDTAEEDYDWYWHDGVCLHGPYYTEVETQDAIARFKRIKHRKYLKMASELNWFEEDEGRFLSESDKAYIERTVEIIHRVRLAYHEEDNG